jgi:predicted esterase
MGSRLVRLTQAATSESQDVCPVIAIGGNLREMHEFGRSISSGMVVSPQGPYGVYEGANDLVARSWYYEVDDVALPEPISFGHSLRAIESLLYEVHDQLAPGASAPILLGEGQGASLVLALARILPDYLSGVVAIEGHVVDFPGWAFDVPSEGLPVLMLGESTADPRRSPAGLEQLGCEVDSRRLSEGQALGYTGIGAVSDWLQHSGLSG